jgi:uncharacterized protein YkvS
MINASTIMQQLLDWFKDDPELHDYTMSRGEFLNEDAGLAINGWIGLYRRSLNYDPRNLGVPPNNYDADLSFVVVVQKAHLGSGAECEDALEESVKAVLDRMVQVPRTYIDHFSDIVVEYTYIETDRTTMYFQGALIAVTAHVSVEVK